MANKIPNPYGVPKHKIEAAKALVEKALDGDRVAATQLSEAVSTSDAPLALAVVINANLLPQYEARPAFWNRIATRRTVSSFRNVRFVDIVGAFDKLENAGSQPGGILPVVPELAPYPEVGIVSTETAINNRKRGAAFSLSWEEYRDDPIGFFADFPNQLAKLATDTEDWAVTDALVSGVTSFSQIDAGTAFDGTAVPANAPLTFESLSLALSQVARRKINGRFVQVSRFVLVVPPTLELLAQFIVNRTDIRINPGVTDGASYGVGNFNPLGNIEVVVDQWLTSDTAWYVVPAPGATARIALVQTFLSGEEAPELRVEGLAGGYYAGGGQVPFGEGNFKNDSISFRLRTVGGSGLVSEEGIVWSAGTGTA